MNSKSKNIVIYRLGALGDTVVSLPSLRLVAKAFPYSKRFLLTNFSNNKKEAHIGSVLDGTGLVHGYIEYPIGLRNPLELLKLIRRIRLARANILVYLAEPRGILRTIRDYIFFKLCGFKKIIGAPLTKDMQNIRQINKDLYEYEGERLARCINILGDARTQDIASYNLNITNNESMTAGAILNEVSGKFVIAASIGAKVSVKDWGDDRWEMLLDKLALSNLNAVLVMLGSLDEYERSKNLARSWEGRFINLCGRTDVRISAAVLNKCDIYIGHDSGPMHLAAAVGVPCVTIFSSRNLPGEWFPCGKGHHVIYKSIDCQGCKRDTCFDRKKSCIRGITVDEVENAIYAVLKKT